VHQAHRLVNDLVRERPRRSCLLPGGAPVSFKRLLGGAARITLYDMKTAALTIRLDPELQRQLTRLARRTGRSRSELARDALRRQLALMQFDELRRRILPFAEARGYLTDDDVFRDIS
jgi:predicted transcriptional regulator